MGIAESRGQEPAVLVREGGARVRDLAPGLVGVPGLESVLDTPVPAAIKPAAAPAQLSKSTVNTRPGVIRPERVITTRSP